MTVRNVIGQPTNTVPGLLYDQYAVMPEVAILLLTASMATPDENEPLLGRLLDGPLQWQTVLDLGSLHGVIGLLYRRLRASPRWDGLPEQLRLVLDRYHRAMRLEHFGLARQLAELLDLAAASGLHPIVLKGVALAATVYADPTLRPMGDIDLLTTPECLDELLAVMAQLRYAHEPLYYSVEFNSERGYHFRFTDPRGERRPVEVHWDLASRLERRSRLTAAALEQRTVPARVVRLDGTPTREARVLAPAAQMVYLATHAATEGHALGRLIWLVDVAAVGQALTAADWDATVDLAGRARAKTATFLVLTLARNMLSAPVPAHVLAALRPARLVLQALDRVLNPRVILSSVTDERRAMVKYLAVDNPATTVRLLCERLFPPPAVMRVYAPDLAARDLRAAYVRHVTDIGHAAMRKLSVALCAGPEDGPSRDNRNAPRAD